MAIVFPYPREVCGGSNEAEKLGYYEVLMFFRTLARFRGVITNDQPSNKLNFIRFRTLTRILGGLTDGRTPNIHFAYAFPSPLED